MAGIGGILDIVKLRKTGSKTGQIRFQIFLLTFLNSLGQDGSNGTPFYAVRSILTSNLDLDLDLRPRKPQKKFFAKKSFRSHKMCCCIIEMPKKHCI